MNDVLDGWSTPWRAFHKRLAMAAPAADWKQDQTAGTNSWLRQARATAETTRLRADQETGH